MLPSWHHASLCFLSSLEHEGTQHWQSDLLLAGTTAGRYLYTEGSAQPLVTRCLQMAELRGWEGCVPPAVLNATCRPGTAQCHVSMFRVLYFTTQLQFSDGTSSCGYE